MKKLGEWKILLFTLISGIVIGILTFLQFTRPDSDSELSELGNEGDKLADEVAELEAELDGLGEELLTDEESAEFWEGLE